MGATLCCLSLCRSKGKLCNVAEIFSKPQETRPGHPSDSCELESSGALWLACEMTWDDCIGSGLKTVNTCVRQVQMISTSICEVCIIWKERSTCIFSQKCNGLVTFEVILIQRLKCWKRTKNSAKQVSASVISSVRSPARRASQRCRCWKHVWIWVHQSGKASKKTGSVAACCSQIFIFVWHGYLPRRGTLMYSDGSRPENPSTCSKAGPSLQSDNEEHEVWGWAWLGCCTDRKTFCVCSLDLKVTVRGRGIKKKHPKRKEGRKEWSHFHRDQTENLTPKSGLGLENPLKMTQLIQLDVKFDPNSSDLRVLFGNPVIFVLPRVRGMVWWAARQFWAPQFSWCWWHKEWHKAGQFS